MKKSAKAEKTPCILMVGPWKYKSGGIYHVVKNYENSGLLEAFHVRLFDNSRGGTNPKRAKGRGYKSIFSQGASALLKKTILAAVNFFRFLWIMADRTIDIVHMHTTSRLVFFESAACSFIAKIAGKKVIWHYHHDFETYYNRAPRWEKRSIAFFFRYCDVFLSLVESAKGLVHSLCPQTFFLYLPNTLDPSSMTKKEHQLQRPVLKVLFIGGSESFLKGLVTVVNIIQRKSPKYEFTLVAVPKNEIQRYALDSCPQVKIIEFMEGEEKKKVFLESDIFILPTYTEGFPLSMLETMAAGLPIIATPVGGVKEVITEGQNGLLVPPGDAEALFRALERLHGDANLRSRLASNGYETVTKNFSMERSRDILSQLYTRLRND